MSNTVCTVLQDQSFLSPSGFLVSIHKCPNVNFFAQAANIPGLTLANVDSENPFVAISHPGDHIQYNEWEITFKVDEALKNYMEIYNWITLTGFPDNYDQRKLIESQSKSSGNGIYSDATLMVLNNSKNPIFTCTFRDAFPVALSDLQFVSNASDVDYLSASAMFRYTSFAINPVT